MKEMVNPLPCYSCTMMTFGSLFGLGSLPLIASVNSKQLLFLLFIYFFQHGENKLFKLHVFYFYFMGESKIWVRIVQFH